MATITIKIDPESKKARYLLGLINELAKTDKGIEVIGDKTDFMKSVDKSFEELSRAREGKLKLNKARNILDEL